MTLSFVKLKAQQLEQTFKQLTTGAIKVAYIHSWLLKKMPWGRRLRTLRLQEKGLQDKRRVKLFGISATVLPV